MQNRSVAVLKCNRKDIYSLRSAGQRAERYNIHRGHKDEIEGRKGQKTGDEKVQERKLKGQERAP